MPGDRLKKNHPEIQVWISAWDRLFFQPASLASSKTATYQRDSTLCGAEYFQKGLLFPKELGKEKINFHPASLAAKMLLSRETWQILSIRQCFCSQGGWLKNICPKIQAKTQVSISVATLFIQPPGTNQAVAACAIFSVDLLGIQQGRLQMTIT